MTDKIEEMKTYFIRELNHMIPCGIVVVKAESAEKAKKSIQTYFADQISEKTLAGLTVLQDNYVLAQWTRDCGERDFVKE